MLYASACREHEDHRDIKTTITEQLCACAVEEESVRVRKDSAWRRRFQEELQESDSGRDSARDIDTDTHQHPKDNGRCPTRPASITN